MHCKSNWCPRIHFGVTIFQAPAFGCEMSVVKMLRSINQVRQSKLFPVYAKASQVEARCLATTPDRAYAPPWMLGRIRKLAIQGSFKRDREECSIPVSSLNAAILEQNLKLLSWSCVLGTNHGRSPAELHRRRTGTAVPGDCTNQRGGL